MSNKREKIVILSGAGMSVESGLQTFRGEGGLWQGHRVEEVASIDAWYRNPQMVLDFYNMRRAKLKDVHPNAAHFACVKLEEKYSVQVVTQNVDDLHERAGSKNVLHLHGALRKVRSTIDPNYIINWEEDLNLGHLCPSGGQLRPHIVWFGEEVPMMYTAVHEMIDANIAIIIGTSMKVYPAAGLISYVPSSCMIYYIDPMATMNFEFRNYDRIELLKSTAVEGMNRLLKELL